MVLITKRLKNKQKINIIKNVLSNFDILLVELLIIIIDDNQINNLLLIANKFKRLASNKSTINSLDIISAVKLEQSQIDTISESLFSQFKNNPKINVTINQNIIGGIKLRIGNKIFDNSISYQINQLKRILHNM